TRQESPFDPFDERFDTAFLIARARVARLRMEAELPGEVQQRGRPDGLTGGIAPAGHRLHVVKDEHPGYPPEGHDAVDQATEERFLTHVRGPTQPRPAAVLEPAGQDVPRRRRPLRERESADLAPIDLEIF